MITSLVTATDRPSLVVPVAPYQIEFRPRLSVSGAPEIVGTSSDPAAGRASIESWAHTLLDQRRSGEIHLVETATGRSVAFRPVWTTGEVPLPAWVSWHRFAVRPAR